MSSPTWIVRLAPTDIFPKIDIPVVEHQFFRYAARARLGLPPGLFRSARRRQYPQQRQLEQGNI